MSGEVLCIKAAVVSFRPAVSMSTKRPRQESTEPRKQKKIDYHALAHTLATQQAKQDYSQVANHQCKILVTGRTKFPLAEEEPFTYTLLARYPLGYRWSSVAKYVGKTVDTLKDQVRGALYLMLGEYVSEHTKITFTVHGEVDEVSWLKTRICQMKGNFYCPSS